VALAVLFPGQGSQYPGMADPWKGHPAGAGALDEASEALETDVVHACRDDALLSTTAFAQPALLACDVAAWRVLEAEGIAAEAAAGHSLGEFAALVAAGALGYDDALALVAERGRAMQEASDERPSAMTALIGVSAADAAEICEVAGRGDVLAVANENAPSQVVLSGSIAAVERAEEAARSRRARAVRLNVAGAFHSPLMQSAAARMREALSTTTFTDPRFPVAANVSGRLIGNAAAFRDVLARHVVAPVRWERSMRSLGDAGIDTFVEAGPGDVLTKLARRILPDARAVAVGSAEEAVRFARERTGETVG
jgi:[acyl-carrier-protein] S-malonyltransferase